MSFLTKDNMKLLMSILSEYMMDKYNMQINVEEVRKIVYDTMIGVDKDPRSKGITVQKANVIVLNHVKEELVKQHGSKKPNVSNLARDKMVFGDRHLQTSMIVPEMDPYVKRAADTPPLPPSSNGNNIDRVIMERNRDVGMDKTALPDVTQLIPPTKDVAENADDFIKKLKDFESMRSVPTPPAPGPAPPAPIAVSQTMPPPPVSIPTSHKNFLIDSTNRNLSTHPQRYTYSLDAPTLSDTQIQVKSIILPDEASIALPYIVLNIDNQSVELRSVSTLLVPKSNRSYVQLEPLRDANIKVTSPRIEISFTRPQGGLLNPQADAHQILKIEVDTEHPLMFKIITRDYFDKKEFKVGDIMRINNYTIKKTSVYQLDNDLKSLNDYLASKDGFEVLELPDPNVNGYMNAIYIAAPCTLNKNNGTLQAHSNIINCLNNYNSQTLQPTPQGQLLNLSLQHCINVIATAPHHRTS